VRASRERTAPCSQTGWHFTTSPGPKSAPTASFREALRDVAAASPHANVHLLSGRDVLDDVTGLSTDLVHPADDGMVRMNERLADRLADLV
jgi:lysophospholipase L1-like esterase